MTIMYVQNNALQTQFYFYSYLINIARVYFRVLKPLSFYLGTIEFLHQNQKKKILN